MEGQRTVTLCDLLEGFLRDLKKSIVCLGNTSSLCLRSIKEHFGTLRREFQCYFVFYRFITLVTVWRIDWWGIGETHCEALATVQGENNEVSDVEAEILQKDA